MEPTTSELLLSSYYSSLYDASKERYMKKLGLISKIDSYFRMERRSKKRFGRVRVVELAWCRLYRYLQFSYSLPRHVTQKIKSFESLEGYNQFKNSWVSGIVVTVVPSNKPNIYLSVHSSSKALPKTIRWFTESMAGCQRRWRSCVCSL